MVLIAAILLSVGAIVFTLLVRGSDIPQTPPPSPAQHLEDRKAQIYENLRDLQFEYRVGKLSDADYQKTKIDLQKELARVLAEIEAVLPAASRAAGAPASAPAKAAAAAVPAATDDGGRKLCPHCGANFAKRMKFCGECGKAMA